MHTDPEIWVYEFKLKGYVYTSEEFDNWGDAYDAYIDNMTALMEAGIDLSLMSYRYLKQIK